MVKREARDSVESSTMDGLLLIDKPKNWTSHDVVAKVRGILKKAAGHKIKVGHTGTLDPMATGLMVVVTGAYCKRAQEFSRLDKIYEVTMKLGEESTTGDIEGEKTKISTHSPNQDEVQQALEQFIGDSEQIPPAYSAIKVDGKRAYQLARAGKEIKLEPRKVTIYNLQMTEYSYPEVKFTTKVSSGTYIRSLVEDVGRLLKTGAYMSHLRRTEVGEFKLSTANQIAGFTPEDIHNRLLDK